MNFETEIAKKLKSKSWYSIDPFHKVFSNNSRFEELEKFYSKIYKNEYLQKVSKLIFSVICEADVYIEITEIDNSTYKLKYKDLEYTNLANNNFDFIYELIKDIIENEICNLNIYFTDSNSLLTLSPYLQIALYSEENELISEVSTLSNAEGLYFRKIFD